MTALRPTRFRLRPWQFVVFSAAISAAALLIDSVADAEGSEDAPAKECVLVHTEAPYVPYGYNHIVVLKNTCDTTMRCEVKTDVNPKIQIVSLAVGEEKRITTFVGSPSRTFTPTVNCKKP